MDGGGSDKRKQRADNGGNEGIFIAKIQVLTQWS